MRGVTENTLCVVGVRGETSPHKISVFSLLDSNLKSFENMLYNTIIKRFPDGTEQYLVCDILKDTEEFTNKTVEHNGQSVERKEIDNMKRAKQTVFDICRSNHFDYFITLTVDPNKCNSFDYDETSKELAKYRKWLTEHQCKYIIVPEQHKSGRYHFHGLIQGYLPLVPAKTKEGKVLDDVFWVKDYKLGYNTATLIKDDKRVSTYITKYLSKDMSVPKGKKRFWASNKLTRPTIEKSVVCLDDLSSALFSSSYYKIIKSDFGTFYLIENPSNISSKSIPFCSVRGR